MRSRTWVNDSRREARYAAFVSSLRRLLQDHRALALWLALAALSVKLLVPAGFMVGTRGGHAVLEICSGIGPLAPAAAPMGVAMTGAMDVAMTGAMAGAHHGEADHAKSESPCPYAALAHGATTPVDPVLFAAALAFILALGFLAVVARLPRPGSYLRPFLRGPPVVS